MNHESHLRRGESGSPRSFWRSRCAIGLPAFGAIALAFLLAEHRAPLLGALPYLLLVAAPILHVFMHGGHDSNDLSRKAKNVDATSSDTSIDATRHLGGGEKP